MTSTFKAGDWVIYVPDKKAVKLANPIAFATEDDQEVGTADLRPLTQEERFLQGQERVYQLTEQLAQLKKELAAEIANL
jgi:hypothetical protein